MAVSHRNGIALTALSHLNGIAKASISAIGGIATGGGGRSLVMSDAFNRASLGSDWQNLAALSGGNIITASSLYFTCTTSSYHGDAAAARWVGAGSVGNDQYAEATYVTFGGIGAANYGVGVICRASTDTDSARDYYYFVVQDNGVGVLAKIVNGTVTILNEAGVSWASGDRVALECVGTTIRACKGTSPLGGAWTQTDSSLTSGGVGVMSMGAINGDDFGGGDYA